VLGARQVGDREDIFEKWNQLVDIWQKKRVSLGGVDRREEEQEIADRIGLYAMMRAGYQPSQMAAPFDRITENKGNKGNFFTDLFGVTNPESKRFRLMIDKAKMPSECISTAPAGSAEHFLAWQKRVIAARRLEVKEKVATLHSKVALQPPLRGSLEYLQFSPDGNYILARDEGSVFLLRTHPLTNLFRFDALNAQAYQLRRGVLDTFHDLSALSDEPVQFTPDSHSVLFYDMELRVEKWDIESQKQTSVREVAVSLPGWCVRTSLSSDGEVLACIRYDRFGFRLLLIDVASNTAFFSKGLDFPLTPDFYDFAAQPYRFFPSQGYAYFTLGFSSDAHYFVLSTGRMTVAYDLELRREIPTTDSIRRYTSSRFVFTGPRDIVGLDPVRRDRAAWLRFPSGEINSQFSLTVNGWPLVNVKGVEGKFIASGKGGYLLVSPAGRWPMAIFDIEAGDFVIGYKSPGLAVYADTLAAEELGGKIGLYNLSDRKPLASVQLPLSPLPDLDSASFSADGKWLAIAGRTSGGVWNAETGERVMSTETFTGAFFDRDKFFAIFHKLEQAPKVQSLDPFSGKEEELFTIDLPDPPKKNKAMSSYVWQSGNLLVEQRDRKEPANCPTFNTTAFNTCKTEEMCLSCKWHVQARDVRTNHVLWSHSFVEFLPTFFYSNAGKTLTLLFDSHYAAKAETKDKPGLKERFDQMPDKDALNLIQVLDAETGDSLGGVLVDTGIAVARSAIRTPSLVLNDALAAGDTVLAYDTQNRTHVYSLKSGQLRGYITGRFRAISATGDMILVENAKGECKVFDAVTVRPLHEFQLPMRVVHADFAADGTLLILCADQNIYRITPPNKLAGFSVGFSNSSGR
jgi:hypothetical protein